MTKSQRSARDQQAALGVATTRWDERVAASLEALRYEPPGEWGRLLGLDRIPEVRTLRDKLGVLCAAGAPVREWSSALAREWMAAATGERRHALH